ncbi:hypothetical protein CSC94_01190 [Zhengella mangrovi]|uniref:Uncharacterized protein n=1 Tax=Zhengella mangrovi TaxID=1982044 RepID=A0A2G1QSX6_9HYPH|nr:hypothetical protein [Zhengella mangrovi]PHP68646.1 hypothetical protein CSC94_01190 [Zhengella mangrovi]
MLGALIVNVVAMAVAWAVGWGVGALLVFHIPGDPQLTLNQILQSGFTASDINFATEAAAAGLVAGAAAGLLMVFPFAGVMVAGPGRFLLVAGGWALAMSLSVYAAIRFNFYTVEHIVGYIAACGVIIGLVNAITLAGRKKGGMVFRVLLAALIFGAAAGVIRYALLQSSGL